MKDKLCVSERRTRILEFLVQRKHSTMFELSSKFNVSTDTIGRDISYLSTVAPVYTKQGNRGGIYILPEYRSYKNYLTEKEEKCLYDLMALANHVQKHILCGILAKFSKKAIS